MTGDIPYSHLEIEDFREEVINNKATPYISSFFPTNLVKILNMCWAPVETRPDIQLIYSKLSNLKLIN